LKYLDGKRLRRAVNAGSLWLNNNRERLNAINVFPVADGDTGTNMALTLQAAVSGANSSRSDSLQDVADSIALHSLRGARGNSGVILSQYFKGVAGCIHKRDKLNLQEVADVFTAGSESAYSALQEPKEGTILTVIREIAEHLQDSKSRFSSLINLMHSAVERGRSSLSDTKFKLKVLADADVVDAGGQGFVHFVEGIYRFIKSGDLISSVSSSSAESDIPRMVEEHSAFRYCSEFLVKGHGFDTGDIKHRLENLGDSLIVGSTSMYQDEYLRIHIHTDNPDQVRDIASSLGELETSKVDDMKKQNSAMRLWRAKFSRGSVKKTIRIVTDSTSDLPQDIAKFHDIEVVPLKVMFGEEIFNDGIDLDKERFYSMLRQSSELPKTSQPSPGDFAESYQRVFGRGDCDNIISIHVSSKLSGTFNSSILAGKDFKNKIMHFDSGSVSLGLGMIAIIAAEAVRAGNSVEEILLKLEKYRRNQKLVFTLGTLEYLIKGGRVKGAKAMLGKFLGLRPLLSLVDGEIVPIGKARSDERLLEKAIDMFSGDDKEGRWAFGHADCADRGREVTSVLKSRMGIENILEGEIGPTVGTHAGPGTWGIFYTKG